MWPVDEQLSTDNFRESSMLCAIVCYLSTRNLQSLFANDLSMKYSAVQWEEGVETVQSVILSNNKPIALQRAPTIIFTLF